MGALNSLQNNTPQSNHNYGFLYPIFFFGVFTSAVVYLLMNSSAIHGYFNFSSYSTADCVIFALNILCISCCIFTILWNSSAAHNIRITNFIYALIAKYASQQGEDPGEKKEEINVLFVFAHPDDEAMFFAPTLKLLASSENRFKLFFLCLSSGNYEGLGELRKRELYESASRIGLSKSQVTIIDDTKLQDGPDTVWSETAVHQYVKQSIDENKIRVVFTFDEHGVSRHPNHISVFQGVLSVHMELLKELDNSADKDKTSVVDVSNTTNMKPLPHVFFFKLRSQSNLFRKYCGIFELILTTLDIRSNNWDAATSLTFQTSLTLMKAHYSQFVWYRRLSVLFSSYSYVNVYEALI